MNSMTAKKILRGKEAEKAILDAIEKETEFFERYYAIEFGVDLNAKPKTNAEKLQQFCKKSMDAHGEGYKGYMVDGVKRFLLATPNVKLEQMTKLIDAVAPAAVYDKQYTEKLKSSIRNDKEFQAKLADIKKFSDTRGR